MIRTYLAIIAGSFFIWSSCRAEPVVIHFATPVLSDRAAASVKSFVTITNGQIHDVGQIVVSDVGPNTLAALQSGKIELAAIPTSVLGPDKTKGMAIFELPFLLNDLAETGRLQEGALGEAMLASLQSQGLVGVGFWNVAMRRILGPSLQSAEGLKGKKILTPAPSETKRTLTALGSTPVTTKDAEVFAALQMGVVDAVDTTPNQALNGHLYETRKNLVETALRPQVLVLATTEAFWNTLPFQIQSQLAEQIRITGLELNFVVQESEKEASLALQGRGVSTVAWSPESVAGVRRSVRITADKDKATESDRLLQVTLNSLQQGQELAFPQNQPTLGLESTGGTRTLFFATDRKAEMATDPNFRFGSRRGGLTYGTVNVDLGLSRSLGAPGTGTKIKNIDSYLDQSRFISALISALNAAAQKDILVYVHGYANNFGDAAESLALLMDDLKFRGVGIFFSWPSDGAALRYPHDESESETSRDALITLLTALKELKTANHISIVAHSMGSRVVGNALEWISTLPAAQRPLMSDVVFAAPDVYTSRFQQMITKFAKAAKQITLYASSNDQALICSRLLHEGPRAGLAGDDLIVDPLIQTIDVSNAEAEAFWGQFAASLGASYFYWVVMKSCRSGHSYVTRNFSVLNDLHALVIDHKTPDARIGLEQRESKKFHYWRMRGVASP